MGTWESDAVIFDTRSSNVMFNLWWEKILTMRTMTQLLDLQWTIFVDGIDGIPIH